MDIVLKTDNKGFTLLEMLLSMFIVSSFMLLILRSYKDLDFAHYYFMNDYLLSQSNAMKNNRKEYIDYGLNFNGSGHINISKTIRINNHDIIVHLATGYLSYE